MTWPRLLMWGSPTLLALTAVALWQGLLIEFAALVTAGLFATAFLRR